MKKYTVILSAKVDIEVDADGETEAMLYAHKELHEVLNKGYMDDKLLGFNIGVSNVVRLGEKERAHRELVPTCSI